MENGSALSLSKIVEKDENVFSKSYGDVNLSVKTNNLAVTGDGDFAVKNEIRDQYYKTIFAVIKLPENYAKILMHRVRCSVSFQLDIGICTFILMVQIYRCKPI